MGFNVRRCRADILAQCSGAVWKSRWPSWAPVPNKPTVSVDVKQHSTQQRWHIRDHNSKLIRPLLGVSFSFFNSPRYLRQRKWNETHLNQDGFFFNPLDAPHIYMRAWTLYVASTVFLVPKPVGGQLHGDKECPFSGVTSSGRVWRKVRESDARRVHTSVRFLCFILFIILHRPLQTLQWPVQDYEPAITASVCQLACLSIIFPRNTVQY